MTNEYKSIYSTTDFPTYVMGFLTVIMKKIRYYGMIDGMTPEKGVKTPNKLIIPIISKKYPFCFEGINLINKTINRSGLTCNLTKYSPTTDNKYEYNFTVTKKK